MHKDHYGPACGKAAYRIVQLFGQPAAFVGGFGVAAALIREPLPGFRCSVAFARNARFAFAFNQTGRQILEQLSSFHVSRLQFHALFEHVDVDGVILYSFRELLNVVGEVYVKIFRFGELEPYKPHGAKRVRFALRFQLYETFRVYMCQRYELIPFKICCKHEFIFERLSVEM